MNHEARRNSFCRPVPVNGLSNRHCAPSSGVVGGVHGVSVSPQRPQVALEDGDYEPTLTRFAGN
jgi:hypothetical protein